MDDKRFNTFFNNTFTCNTLKNKLLHPAAPFTIHINGSYFFFMSLHYRYLFLALVGSDNLFRLVARERENSSFPSADPTAFSLSMGGVATVGTPPARPFDKPF